MDILFYACMYSFFGLSVLWLLRIIYSNYWIHKQLHATGNNPKAIGCVHVIIPVLAEVGRIGKTAEYFIDTFANKINFKLILVSTEKEWGDYGGAPNTIDVCTSLAKRYPEVVLHLHYPETTGRMAHQLNYAIKNIGKSLGADDIIAIYNADSRPHPLTFQWVLSRRADNARLGVFQQYGDYTQNISKKTGAVLLSAALWQNRWAVGFELFNSIKSERFYSNQGIMRSLNYCIGHGLFISKEIIERAGGFSEIFHNEDAILGLELSHLKERISPIPFFDTSDTPDTIRGLYSQKINWFFGPFQAFNYFRKLNDKYKDNLFLEKIVLFVQSFKLFLHAIYWICGPSAMVYVLLYPIIRGDIVLFLFSYSSFFAFFVLPNILSVVGSDIQEKKYILSPMVIIKLLYGGPVCYFLHGLSAISAVALSAKNFFTGKPIKKGKTLMRLK